MPQKFYLPTKDLKIAKYLSFFVCFISNMLLPKEDVLIMKTKKRKNYRLLNSSTVSPASLIIARKVAFGMSFPG